MAGHDDRRFECDGKRKYAGHEHCSHHHERYNLGCHTFAGWNTRADGTGISYAAGSGTFSISDNTVLYAKWAEAHSSSSDWMSDKDATATESGSKHEECTICGFKKACVEILPVGPSAPQTGDNNRVESSLAVMLLALGGIAAAITIGRKKSRMAK